MAFPAGVNLHSRVRKTCASCCDSHIPAFPPGEEERPTVQGPQRRDWRPLQGDNPDLGINGTPSAAAVQPSKKNKKTFTHFDCMIYYAVFCAGGLFKEPQRVGISLISLHVCCPAGPAGPWAETMSWTNPKQRACTATKTHGLSVGAPILASQSVGGKNRNSFFAIHKCRGGPFGMAIFLTAGLQGINGACTNHRLHPNRSPAVQPYNVRWRSWRCVFFFQLR